LVRAAKGRPAAGAAAPPTIATTDGVYVFAGQSQLCNPSFSNIENTDLYVPSVDTWLRRAPTFCENLKDIGGTHIRSGLDQVIVHAGGVGSFGVKAATRMYKPDNWIVANDMNPPFRAGMVAFERINRGVFVAGGDQTDIFSTVSQFFPGTLSWGVGNALPIATSNGAGFSLEDKGWYHGGKQFSTAVVNRMWRFTGGWASMSSPPLQAPNVFGLTQHSAFGIAADSEGYFCSGIRDGSTIFTTDVLRWNVATETWSAAGVVASLPANRAEASGAAFDNKGYIHAGQADSGAAERSEHYQYSPVTDVWKKVAPVPQPKRKRHAAASYGD